MGHQSKTCEDCRFCVLEDNGYSNYTIEGTDFTCAKGLHPDGSFDQWYGTDDRLKYAEKCPGFTEGESIHMDVDQDNVDNLTAEQKKVWGMIH